MTFRYPCDRCLVSPICKERCSRLENYAYILNLYLGTLLFAVIALGIFMIFGGDMFLPMIAEHLILIYTIPTIIVVVGVCWYCIHMNSVIIKRWGI